MKDLQASFTFSAEALFRKFPAKTAYSIILDLIIKKKTPKQNKNHKNPQLRLKKRGFERVT